MPAISKLGIAWPRSADFSQRGTRCVASSSLLALLVVVRVDETLESMMLAVETDAMVGCKLVAEYGYGKMLYCVFDGV